MNSLLHNWTLVEEHEGSFIFVNNDHSFHVFIDFNHQLKQPFTIGYEQLEGDYELIDFEDGTFTTKAFTKQEALNKALLLMQFVNLKVNGSDDVVDD